MQTTTISYLTLLLTIIILATCDTVTGQNLRVKIYNKTGYDIDSLYIRTTYIGHIPKDSARNATISKLAKVEAGARDERF